MKTVKCERCNGNGWYEDHSPAHYVNPSDPEGCSKYGCPVQVQCEECQGRGYFTTELINTEDGKNPTKEEIFEANLSNILKNAIEYRNY